MQRARAHHVDGPLDNLRLVYLDRVGDASSDGPESQHRRGDEDYRQGKARRAQIAGFTPLALDQMKCSSPVHAASPERRATSKNRVARRKKHRSVT